MKIVNQSKNYLLASDSELAATFFRRLKGLLGRRDFKKGQGLIIKPCDCIHTFFMQFPIDVLFIDEDNKVTGIENRILPWRISRIYLKAKLAIELPAGIISESNTAKGDQIVFV